VADANNIRALKVIAGPRARAHIRQHGLRQEDIRVMVGASGGPKWLCLAALDEYLFAEFFHGRRTPLDLLGSSSGAWRFACFAQQDPAAASRRFRDAYHHLRIPPGSGIDEISRLSQLLLDAAVPTPEHVGHILDNPAIRLNFIVNRARPLAAARSRWLQAAGLGLAASANMFHRRALGLFFERVLFHTGGDKPSFHDVNDLPTRRVPLTSDNLRPALLASGSIPMVLNAVEDIPGAGPGRYYDGGVTDYHFDMPFSREGLVLYPHFYSRITPGWFDKALRWRRPHPAHYDNVVMLCPSQEWVASLPGGRIPDRHDFERFSDVEREQRWQVAIDRSQQLVRDFRALLDGDLSYLAPGS
jgi:hypothetical protein